MRFSVWLPPGWPWEQMVALAAQAEQAGCHGVWYMDHFMPNGPDATPLDGDFLECWSVLGGLAAAVPRVRLGPLVCGNTYRHPAVLAKIAASVDQISGGRVVLGLGAGWQVNEHAAYGIDLPPLTERFDRLEEACQVVTGLLRQPRTTVAGNYYALTDAPCQPTPVQNPLPLLVGGGGERRTIPIAARYADEWNVWGMPDTVTHKALVLDRGCEAIGRDPATVVRSTQALVRITDTPSSPPANSARPVLRGTPEQIADLLASYQPAGVSEFILPVWDTFEAASELTTRFMTEVAPLVEAA